MATTCKFLKIEEKSIKQFGETDMLYFINNCELKMKDESERVRMTLIFMQIGLPNSIPNNECPFAIIDKFEKCPYYQPNI